MLLSGLGNVYYPKNKNSNNGYVVSGLPPFSLIRDFRKENTRGNVSKISVNHACYRGQKVTLVAVIGGFRSDLSITCMIDGNFGNVSAGVLFSKVAYQRKRW